MDSSFTRRRSSTHMTTTTKPTTERLRRLKKMNSHQKKACTTVPRKFSRNSSILLDLNSSIFEITGDGMGGEYSMKELDLSSPCRMDMLDSSTNEVWSVDGTGYGGMEDDSARSTDSTLSDFFNARVQTFTHNMNVIGDWIKGGSDATNEMQDEEEDEESRNAKRQALLLAS